MAKTWRVIPCAISELRLEHTLKCGQSFRWREVSPDEWTGVIGNQVWKLKQDKFHLYYQVFGNQEKSLETDCQSLSNSMQSKKSEHKDSLLTHQNELLHTPKQHDIHYENDTNNKYKLNAEETSAAKWDSENDKILKDYFQLEVTLCKLYKSWSVSDANFKKIASTFQGIRMLRQDPVENLFSFICSSNNHISRISSMVEKLCNNYGDEIAEVDGIVYHAFPKIAALAADDVEAHLRDLGFGYRAKYISKTAQHICSSHSEAWLFSLRTKSYRETKKELMKLCGVGAKVADCVCLMSLDKCGAIPVDTHVWQIAARHYLPKLQQSKSLTDKLYDEIGDYFRDLWGEYAGWAHSVLFAADLKHFKDVKNEKKEERVLKTVKRPAPKKVQQSSKGKKSKTS